MSETLGDYYAALERLKQRKEKINNDTVAIEAGRGKGSIKKSRPQFARLIEAIELARRQGNASRNVLKERLARTKQSRDELQHRLDSALARELSLIREVFDLRKELADLRGGNVLPFRVDERT